MLSFLKECCRWKIKNNYPSLFVFFCALFSLGLSLSIYYFTTRGFQNLVSEEFNLYGMDYFSYVVWGEALLIIPLALMSSFSKSFREIVTYGIQDQFRMSPLGWKRAFFCFSLAELPIEGIRLMLTLLIGVMGFGLILPFQAIGGLFLIQLSIYPLFLGLGLLSVSVYQTYGRGDHWVGYGVNLLTIFSGLYFPIQVLPEWASRFLSLSFPFHSFFQVSRGWILGRVSLNALFQEVLSLSFWSLGFFTIGFFAFWFTSELGFTKNRKILLKY